MKTTKTVVLLFALLLSSSVFAQEKPKKEACKDDCKMECCSKEAKHVCNDECKTNGCKAKADKPCCSKEAKHVCNDECKANGCTAMKGSFECPMKCEPASGKPGECSKCGMELKKKA